MDLDVFVTPGLGDTGYLLRSGDEAVHADPQRDAWRFPTAADGTEPVWVICSNGHRASTAASLLARAETTACPIGTGGVGEWRATCHDLRPTGG